ncbi:DUF692 domain-containing protein [Streptomyces sp. MAR4 CNX-425]|uniref:DUF692 domain-containing protein n=1 Tax=Streptomyces sp. MAR4 CNX-425 TaxID=3406343 RepID=UPI003B50972D
MHESILEYRQEIDFLEIITDQYLDAPEALRLVQETMGLIPIVPHGVEMSIGSQGPVDDEYLQQVRTLAKAVEAPWVSDHLSFTREGGIELGTLTPVQRTRENVRRIARKAQHVQDTLGRRFLLENITYYVELPGDLTESELMSEVMEHCDCGLLLDLHNVVVNARNHGFDPYEFLDEIPLDRVEQVHLAGNVPVSDDYGQLIDGHNAPVGDEVLRLLSHLLDRRQVKGILIERDELPGDFHELLTDLRRARHVAAREGA